MGEPTLIDPKDISLSVLVLTKNEEQDIAGCLESVSWSDDIHVYDSFSEDQTIEIAKQYGATITQRIFDNWSTHQNWGLQNIPFKYSWVFYIDADERATTSLKENMKKAIESPGEHIAFFIRRRDFFMDKWLKHVQTTPYYIRLFRPEYIHYERLVNPVTITRGSTGHIEGYLDHFPFSKGISHWFNRHNSYSTFEAQQMVDEQSNQLEKLHLICWKALISKESHHKRYYQKNIFYRLPARPLLKFFILYFVKRGFLDGSPGFVYAILQTIYEYMIVLKAKEILNSPCRQSQDSPV